MIKQIVGAIFMLAIMAPGVGQSETEAYFSLTSSRTFASGTEATVALSASNVQSVEFRIYRVNDAVRFFDQLEDPQNFGRQVPPRRRAERTFLEKLHGWKRRLRQTIRVGLRQQFTESPMDHLGALVSRETPAPRETRYAEVPALNSQQLVLTFRQNVTTKDRWANQEVPLGLREKGVYMVEASNGTLRAYTIVMVTDLVMTSKVGRGQILTYITDRGNGQPVEGAEVTMMANGEAKAAAKTSADGIVEFPLGERKPEEVRLVARRGSDVAASVHAGYAFQSTEDRWTSYIYTDRPIYRPGHTVHFKGIFRVRTPDGYKLPDVLELPVKIEDSTGKEVFAKRMILNTNGTLNGEFTLPANAALGYYFLQFQAGERLLSDSFEVEEYKKPEYEVHVQPNVSRVLQGGSVTATVEAKYYFGEPVIDATVKYSVYRDPYWFPFWYQDEDEEPSADEFSEFGGYGDEVSQGEGTLDANGKLNIKVPIPVSEYNRDHRYRIEARVTDAARREITGSGSVVATFGSFALFAEPERYFYSPGSMAAVKVEARDYDNRPVATAIRAELLRWDRRDPKDTEVVATGTGSVLANGSGRVELRLPAGGGQFRIRVTARTPEGRMVEDIAYLWVSGSMSRSFDEEDARHDLEIIPDKKSYKAGETAHLMVATGQPNSAVLVTVEGRDLRSHRVLRSPEGTVTFDLPITAKDEPGVFVSARYMRDGSLYQGSKLVRVPPDGHKLNVAVSTDKPQYKPGDTATYNVSVTDVNGKPVPRTEVSLGVVDEAIYAIRRDPAAEMLREFFGNEYNQVVTEDSLNYYFSGEAGTRRMQLAQLRPPTKLAQLKPERPQLPKVRKAFPDTAFWTADLVTDAQGKAKAKVALPDSLTTWRATARGITPDTKVGNTTAKNITRKNLILRFSMPRFFVRGDEMVISALVHNYLESAQSTQVSMQFKGLEVIGGDTKTVTIEPKSEARVDWRVRASQVGMAKITGRALGSQESDALEMEIPVNAPGVKLSESKGGSLLAGSSSSFDLTFPSKVEAGSRRIALRVSPSIAGALFGAVEYLTTFPYGCVEQTMSSFVPNIVVQQTVRDLNLKADLDQARLREKIGDGLDRLYAFQHQDGGWGWWETDESHPFMTAYVVAGLVQAQASSTSVRFDVLDRGAKWLEKELARDTRLAPDLAAYMVYALANRAASRSGQPGPTALLDRVYGNRTRLSPYGLALLGLAFEAVKDPRVDEMATLLERAVHEEGEQAWWPAERDEMLDFNVDATPEATAFAARFLSHQKPASSLLPKAAAWLMNHRNEGYWWSSTKQTAMVIYGLADYLKVTKELNPTFTAKVSINGREVLSKRFDTALGVNESELVIDEAGLQQGQNQLQVTTDGAGRLYYSARAEYFSSDERLERKGAISLNVLRDYFRLVPARQGERIVYDLDPLNGPLQSGDTIAVRLTVTGSAWSYLLIEDPIPSGTEFIARDDKFDIRNRPSWWGYYFTRREMHDDRMATFEREFPAGQQSYFYLLKVVNPGQFYASPARVQPMYQPSVMATTSGRRVEVQE
jgi:uncharacterized protein YfaS (alpha-2-macroglobulin family)